MIQLLQIYTLRVQIVYLHCSSSHPDHIRNSIIYSQTLRLSNICTYEEDFDKHGLNMKSWFLERGYWKQMIDSQMGKIKFGQRLKAGSKQAGVDVPFVIHSLPGGGGLSHFSEGLYRRDLGQIGILVGIGTLGGGDFFQVGHENSLYKKY